MNIIEKHVEITWVDTQAYCHILYERYIAYGIYQSYVSHGSSPCMSHVTNDHTFYHIVYSNLTLATQGMSQIISICLSYMVYAEAYIACPDRWYMFYKQAFRTQLSSSMSSDIFYGLSWLNEKLLSHKREHSVCTEWFLLYCNRTNLINVNVVHLTVFICNCNFREILS